MMAAMDPGLVPVSRRLRPPILRLIGAAALAAALASCAVTPAPEPAPGPPPAMRAGPWETTYALYEPGLFGPERPLSGLIRENRLRLRDGKLARARLLLNKAQRRLELWVGRSMIKAYRVQLGSVPTGRKARRGDHRTPEGEYAICRHSPSTYYVALWISYPNRRDARAGLKAGVISRSEHAAISAARAKGACPPQDTRLGGDLLIHGQLPEHTEEVARRQKARAGLKAGDEDPAKVREFTDWTDGCAGMFNSDIRELYEFIADGTRLTIIANGRPTPPPRERRDP